METITTYGVGPDQPTYAQLREQNRVLREAAKQAMDLIHADIVQGDKAGRRLKAESLLFAALTATSQEGQG